MCFGIVKECENFSFFSKKVREIFAGMKNSSYLCIRFRAKIGADGKKKEFFERLT